MLPTNVVSFVKKMVASDGSSSSYSGLGSQRGSSYRAETSDAGTTLSKLRQTLTSGIHGTVTKLSPSRASYKSDSGISSSTSSLSSGATGGVSSTSISTTSTVSFEERSLLQKVWDKTEKYEPPDHRVTTNPPPISTPTAPVGGTFSSLNPPVNGASSMEASVPKVLRAPGSSCRVCVKSISSSEYFKRCSECGQKVCEDCASYSSTKDDTQDAWHCSICKRKLLSRVKKTTPESKVQPPKPNESFNKTLHENSATHALMSSMIRMASPSAITPITPIQANDFTTTKVAVSSTPPVVVSSTPPVTVKPTTSEENSRKESRRASSRNIAQKSIERSISKDETKERIAGVLRKGKEVSQKNSIIRRRSENEDDSRTIKPALNAARQGHRVSDFMLRDSQVDEISTNNLTKNKLGSINRLNDPPKTGPMPPEILTRSGESSEETISPDGRRGRRRSIVRQKSYDEDAEDPTLLTLWSSGQLPIRRHSAQDPSRRSDHPDLKSKESLDVPQGRVHRHHSWDYDVSRGNSGHESLLPNANPAQCSRFSSESEMSNESTSERGSMVTLAEEQRRRASTSRRSSYRGIKVDETNYSTEEYTNKGHVETGGKDSTRRAGTSSLEDDPFLHPTEDDGKSNRRRSSAVSDSGRVLPTPPASPRISTYCSWGSGSSGAYGRSSQSIESNTSRDMGDESLRKQGSITDGEAIKIVIHDVDTPFKGASKATGEGEIRRLKIKRDLSSSRGGGLGMRIVGGKTSKDGKLIATVVWTVPGGPAECAGVRQGDKVLEWNGVNLFNRSFEDVCLIIEADENTEIIDVLLESASDGSFVESKEENPLVHSQRGSLESRLSLDGDLEKSLMSVSRRKLPKIPGDLHRAPVSGKLQVQIWYDKNNVQLIATVLSAHDLRHREGYFSPEAFVSLRLFPHTDSSIYTTPVADPSTKPLWNSSFLWEKVFADSLMGMTLEISVWDSIFDGENGFLGECLIDLRHSYLDERPTWYRLQERRSRSANTTPRGSIAGYDIPIPTVRRPSSVRSGAEDYHEADDSRHSSMDSGLLHPDLAWRDSRSNSRRGSSLSEQAENEIYQLTRSYPHSLPQSRRSSFAHSSASPEFRAEDLEARLSGIDRPSERRRANSCRVSSQKELLEEAGWKNIGQTPHWLSSSANVHPSNHSSSRRYSTSSRSRSDSLQGGGELQMLLKGSVRFQKQEEELQQTWRSNLGPGQVVPRAYRDILTDDFTLGEIRLELSQTRSYLEVEVSNARGLPAADSGQPPDTYVKTYLKDGDRRLNKQKTRVIRQSNTPNYYQTLRYPLQDLRRRTLLVMVWEKHGHKHTGLGVAEIAVKKLELRRPTTGWYRLLPLSSVDRVEDSDSD